MDAATVTTIAGSADFTTIITGIGTIAAAVGVLYVSIRGGKTLLGFLRS